MSLCIDAHGTISKTKELAEILYPRGFSSQRQAGDGTPPRWPVLFRTSRSSRLSGLSPRSKHEIARFDRRLSPFQSRDPEAPRATATHVGGFEIQGVAGFFLTLLGEAEREESAGAV